jgi:hypothetical protein
MDESKEDMALREQLIADIMHSISIINSNIEELKKDAKEF